MKTTTITACILAGSMSGLIAFAGDTPVSNRNPVENIQPTESVIRVSGAGDLHLLRNDTTKKTVSVLERACVFTSGMRYGVTVLESENRFNLSDGANKLPYTVSFNGQRLVRNATLSGLSGDSRSEDCAGGFNANYAVTVDPVVFNAAPPGSYTDTLTLLISPE